MPTISPGTALHGFVDAIRIAISEVFGSWNVEVSGDDASQLAEGPRVCFGLSLSGALQGNATIQIRQADALLLTQTLRSEAPNPAAELSEEHKQALQTLLQQVTVATATTLEKQLGALKAQVTSIEPPTWPGAPVILHVSKPSAGKMMLELRFDSELLASLAAVNSAGDGSPSVTPSIPTVTESNLDLLLGVRLNLTLRFGQRVVKLREILDLASGSVVDLERQVQDPADLLLGDRVVARGEVVIVDGNYGVKVTEVIDPRQRIDRV
jgi:flagellar motor switch protein FliN